MTKRPPPRGYCYRDFTDKKLRVICLNTADAEESGTVQTSWRERISDTQLAWFASALDLSSKSDAAQWQTLIFSHHPIDWGNVNPLTKFINAYIKGTSITHNTISYNYSGKNKATIIANIHGHTHCFKTDSLYLISNGAGTPINNTRRIAVPNACFTRANEYGENGTTDSNGIEYGEPNVSYEKTADTANDTAFCVFVIDLSAKVIRAFHYGAGIDRTIDYSEVIFNYSITNNLTNIATSNTATTIKSNETYTTTLTANSGYTIENVSITVGGVDVTSSVYNNGNITIISPNGNIIITATAAKDQAYTNIIDTVGYTDGQRLSTSSGTLKEQSGYVTTGHISLKPGDVLRTKGVNFAYGSGTNQYCAFVIYSNGNMTTASYLQTNAHATITVDNEGNLTMTIPSTSSMTDHTYRICGVGTGANLIATINEEIVDE